MGSETVADGVMIRGATATDRSRWLVVNGDGSINVQATMTAPVASSASQSVVSVNNASTTLLTANASRKGGVIENLDASVLGVSLSSPAVFATCPIKLQQYGSLDLGQAWVVYTGAVYGIRAAATGDAGVVEE